MKMLFKLTNQRFNQIGKFVGLPILCGRFYFSTQNQIHI